MNDDTSKSKLIEDNLNAGHYSVVMQNALLSIEKNLRQVIKRDLTRLESADQVKVMAHLASKNKGIDDLTVGEIVGLVRETKFVEMWKKTFGKELQVFDTINLGNLVSLRNSVAHGKQSSYTKEDAELMIAYQKVISKTFALEPTHITVEENQVSQTMVDSSLSKTEINQNIITDSPSPKISPVQKNTQFRAWLVGVGLILTVMFLGQIFSHVLDVSKPQPIEFKAVESFRDTLKDGSLGPEWVQIPGGTFQMGSNDGESDEKPVHLVTVKSFAMGKYEVTRGEFRKFVEATSYQTEAEKGDGCFAWTGSEWKQDSSFNWKNVGFTQDDEHPVVCVSWNDAKAYVKWLSEQTGKDYRLLAEAQWEYACRAGSTGKYSFGDDANQLGSYGWYDKNSDSKTHPVGEKQPNKFGLYDMHGNVWEWLEDKWHSNYEGAPSDGSAWISGDSNTHLLRGGSCSYDDHSLRCPNRNGGGATSWINFGGLRISRVNL